MQTGNSRISVESTADDVVWNVERGCSQRQAETTRRQTGAPDEQLSRTTAAAAAR